MYIDGAIEGKRIILRTCTEELANDAYVSWINSKKVNQFLESRYEQQTKDSIKEYIRNNIESDNQILLAIMDIESGKHLGNVHLTFNSRHKRCFIAYVIGETNWWGKGIATEAIKLSTRWAFENTDIYRMDGGYYSNNIGSGKAVMKAGYLQEGIRCGYCLLDDGERVDEIEVGLTRERFLNLDYSTE